MSRGADPGQLAGVVVSVARPRAGGTGLRRHGKEAGGEQGGHGIGFVGGVGDQDDVARGKLGAEGIRQNGGRGATRPGQGGPDGEFGPRPAR